MSRFYRVILGISSFSLLATLIQCSETDLKLPADEPINLTAICSPGECGDECASEEAAFDPIVFRLVGADDFRVSGWSIQFDVSGAQIDGSDVQVTNEAGEATLDLIADNLADSDGPSNPVVAEAHVVDRPNLKTRVVLTATQDRWLRVLEPQDNPILSAVSYGDGFLVQLEGACGSKIQGVDIAITANDSGDPDQFINRGHQATDANGQAEIDADIQVRCYDVTILIRGPQTNEVALTLRRYAPPTVVCSPRPSDGSTVRVDTQLHWDCGESNGCGLVSTYDVYLGTAPGLGPSQFLGNTSSSDWAPANLEDQTTYYWRVDSRNADGITPGPVWSFTTGEHVN